MGFWHRSEQFAGVLVVFHLQVTWEILNEILKRNMQAAAHYVYGLSGLGSSRAIDSRVEHQLGMARSMVGGFIL